MAKRASATLGIEIAGGEVRGVLVPRGKHQVKAAARVPLPPEAMDRGHITDPARLVAPVQELLGKLGVSGAIGVALGIPCASTAVGQVQIPPVPEAEIPAVVEGEIRHYGLIRTINALHGHIVLQPGPASEAVTPPPPAVAVFGAEEGVISAMLTVAGAVSAPSAIIEPTGYARLRASGPLPEHPVMHLALTAYGADVALTAGDKLRFYRRIDVGSPLTPEGFQALVVDMYRTGEYIGREHPDYQSSTPILVSVDAVEQLPLVAQLAERLNVPTQLVMPQGAPGTDAALELSDPQSAVYAGAAGLALGEAGLLPRLDVYRARRAAKAAQFEKRTILSSAAIAVVALGVGFLGRSMYGRATQRSEEESAAIRRRVTDMRTQATAEIARIEREKRRYKLLRKEGVPLGVVMDTIAKSLEPGVGVREITISPSLAVAIRGEALNEPRLIRMVQRLQGSPVIKGIAVQGFETDLEKRDGLNYELTAGTLSSDLVRYSHEVLPGEIALPAPPNTVTQAPSAEPGTVTR